MAYGGGPPLQLVVLSRSEVDAGSARKMPVRGDRGFPPRRELSGWLRVSFLSGRAAGGCVGAGRLRATPCYLWAWYLWVLVS